MMLRRRAELLLAIVVAAALLAALPSFTIGRDLTPVAIAVRQSTPAIASDGVFFPLSLFAAGHGIRAFGPGGMATIGSSRRRRAERP